jgi:hypothetical protein
MAATHYRVTKLHFRVVAVLGGGHCNQKASLINMIFYLRKVKSQDNGSSMKESEKEG